MSYLHNALLLATVTAFFISCGPKTEYLPIMGPRDVSNEGDTIYHAVPTFKFTDQHNYSISNDDVANKIYCSNFFFTTCRSICPKMNKNLAEVVKAYKDDDRIDFLSHSLDPSSDTPEILSAYADGFEADAKNWHFLTGDEKSIYSLAGVGGYFVNARRDENSLDGIDHSGKVCLVDAEGHIRAYHDLTEEEGIQALINDIEFLLNEK